MNKYCGGWVLPRMIIFLTIIFVSFGILADEQQPVTLEEASANHQVIENSDKKTATRIDKPKQMTTSAVPNYGKNLAEMFLYLGLVVGLIFLLAWFVKKVSNNHFSSTQLMKVQACLPLSTKEKLMIVQIGEQQVVVGVAPGFVGHIMSLDTPIDAQQGTDKSHNKVIKNEGASESGVMQFSLLLERFQKKGG